MLGKLFKYEWRSISKLLRQFMDSCYYLPSYPAFILQ